MRKVIIAAKSDNMVIGAGNDLPWHLPADQAFFRQQIRDCFLLTGRASYESPQGRDIFCGRHDVVVLTRRKDYPAGQAMVVNSMEAAIERAETAGARRLCILGGAEVYEQAIDLADELVITEIHAVFEGDRFFPSIDPAAWQETSRVKHLKDADNPYDYSFVRYKRRLI